MVYKLEGNYEMALKYYMKCLQIQKKSLDNKEINCTTLRNSIEVMDKLEKIGKLESNDQIILKKGRKCL